MEKPPVKSAEAESHRAGFLDAIRCLRFYRQTAAADLLEEELKARARSEPSSAESESKKPYEPPKLTPLGTLNKITLGSAGPRGDTIIPKQS